MSRKKIETDEEFNAALDRIGNSGMSDNDKINAMMDELQISDEELNEITQVLIDALRESDNPEDWASADFHERDMKDRMTNR